MEAVIYRKFGPPTVLGIAKDFPIPRRGPGQLLIKVHAAAVNPVDIATRLGKIPLAKKNKVECEHSGKTASELLYTRLFRWQYLNLSLCNPADSWSRPQRHCGVSRCQFKGAHW